ncbi:integrin beta-PS-like [Euwallacea fornicatus]|uniref:integrin beta-PS-like n=1 Tax=Euwallacea fornicatus TaxID=995702 RepID=UPI00338F72B3
MKFYTFYLVISLWISKMCEAQDCESKDTCDKCIQELDCFWCSSPKSGTTHCLSRSELSSCNNEDTEDPKNSFKIIDANQLTESEQISPQRVQLRLRKNEYYEINFQYRQSANYPVDLYYIMDLSNSMLASKDKLATLGGKLVEQMRRKTTDFLIGFGSFVDKLTLPFVNTHPKTLKEPCKRCAPPYSFKNHLSLINDSTLFSNGVKNTQVSGNLDSPEGGLDAVMQAIVCKEEIGWRPNARHLLVMSTDAESHVAGDGKLGGVVEPNDATCHMKNHEYTHGLVYDYPSVSQINYVARENNINLIFAIVLNSSTESKARQSASSKSFYQALSTVIENSKTGTLDEKSDNVVKFISDIYDEIRDSVRITSDANKNEVDVNITASCASAIPGGCTNVKPGQTINFKANIKPLMCSEDANLNRRTITIKPEGLEDKLVIELEVLCDCGCAANKKQKDANCSYQGDLECGICRCQEGRFGANCQCDWKDSKGEDPSLCIKPGGRGEICSGQGKCICGNCQCKVVPDFNGLIYGKYCECDDFSCPQKCSGKGTCDCGTCRCNNGWTGPGCDCNTDQSQCMAPKTNELCSGHGNCVCGHCQCYTEGDERYSGKYCERCTNCPEQRCDELKDCVECQAYQSGPLANSTVCANNCTTFSTQIIKKLDETTNKGGQKCRVLVEGDCTIQFEYSYDEDDNLVLVAEENKICPYLPQHLVYILGVIASVLLVGIITLIIWKIVTTVHDKSEYARFLKERDKTTWSNGENPLYKPGTSHFQNPAYKRASQRMSTVNQMPKKIEADSNPSQSSQITEK